MYIAAKGTKEETARGPAQALHSGRVVPGNFSHCVRIICSPQEDLRIFAHLATGSNGARGVAG
jgi:hypothetical protein